MKKLILIGTIGILALTSCSKEETTTMSAEECWKHQQEYNKEVLSSNYKKADSIYDAYKKKYPYCFR
jgi:hypothetical protein